ncbi:Cupin [Cupriavidus sp. YR651]|uniref:DUF2917 domain-containing protein n=1 Tax=Cupriavidus sp. YR651 TaxID=1855315 RepID=UPI00088666EC|nr:DUF2917 domain-containing protein [Cupriavidus sp. YR651]SDC40148.1 Cupin [Cupriavidus sp. YR651]
MRELKTFELDEPGLPVSWRAPHGQSVTVLEGRLWLTVEGQIADMWLRPGDVVALPEGTRVWLSGESPVARFRLAESAAPLSLRRIAAIACQLARRWAERKTDAFGDCPQISA